MTWADRVTRQGMSLPLFGNCCIREMRLVLDIWSTIILYNQVINKYGKQENRNLLPVLMHSDVFMYCLQIKFLEILNAWTPNNYKFVMEILFQILTADGYLNHFSNFKYKSSFLFCLQFCYLVKAVTFHQSWSVSLQVLRAVFHVAYFLHGISPGRIFLSQLITWERGINVPSSGKDVYVIKFYKWLSSTCTYLGSGICMHLSQFLFSFCVFVTFANTKYRKESIVLIRKELYLLMYYYCSNSCVPF